MELSIFLAKVLGIYVVVISLAVLTHQKDMEELAKEFSKGGNRALIFITGAFTLILGLAIVVNHNIWEYNWRGGVTALGWLTVFKGAIRLFAADAVAKPSLRVVKSPWYRVLLVGFLILGIWLAYIGFNL